MSNVAIHIGFPKTGSTFLQAYFREHPSIHYDRSVFRHYQETGKVGDELLPKEVSGKHYVLSEEHLSIWAGRPEKNDLKTYNINYDIRQMQATVANRLAAIFPGAKVLIVTREYDSLISSLYSQYLLTGGTCSFSYFSTHHSALVRQMYDYQYVSHTYQQQFGSANVLQLPFELLLQNPKDFLHEIEQFFGFPHFNFNGNVINPSIHRKWMNAVRLLSMVALPTLKLLPEPMRQKTYLRYCKFLYQLKETRQHKPI